ncbi:MAG: adenosylhomocysteinase [Euryarchaeota archaeon]|nr:adenosylhomocysteinase [Euryarchaeota archaeon]
MKIKDINLANKGKKKMEWASNFMPILSSVKKGFKSGKPFKNIRVAMCLHLEAKTALLAETLHLGGAEVRITGSNPLSTQDDICAALVKKGVDVYAWHDLSEEEYYENIETIMEFSPEILIDDGADTIAYAHRKGMLPKGGCEETTTGVIRLKALEKQDKLKFPVINVNDAYCKHLFDNRHGTGQSTLDGIMRTTNVILAGKNFVVAGYGWVGRGIALRARGMGANVIVTEVDEIRGLEAHMDGFRVMTMEETAEIGDIFVTATGCRDVITEKHFDLMKDKVILCNSGHFNVEIDVENLEKTSKREARENITEYEYKGKRVYLLGEGRLVNLACADGHAIEIMDMSFGIQALSAEYILKNELAVRVHDVPKEIDYKVARIKLESLGITIDQLSERQRNYLSSWEVGT